jgi:3-oxosteroid 1-dehydrogenase
MSTESLVVGAASVEWDGEFDVVVVGSGAAGFAAAINAASHGASVLVLEKGIRAGGTTRKSGAWHWHPNNSEMRAAGLTDSRDGFLRYAARLSYPATYDRDADRLGLTPWQYNMLAAFYDNAAAASDAMQELGAFGRVYSDQIPDYGADAPENEAPYGRLFEVYEADPTLRERQSPSGVGGTGETMIAAFLAASERLGIPVLCDHRVTAAIVDDNGAVVGVRVVADGDEKSFAAAQGVIFASGGFTHNDEMRSENLGAHIFSGCAAHTNTGDFVSIATALGAPLHHMNCAWRGSMIFERALVNPAANEAIFFPPGDSMIWVDRSGRRSVNEKTIYNELGRSFDAWDADTFQNPQRIRVMLWDQRSHDRYRPTDPELLERLSGDEVTTKFGGVGGDQVYMARYLLHGDTLDDLVDSIEDRLNTLSTESGGFTLDATFRENLRPTIARFNEMAVAGSDLDFHRGEATISKAFQGPAQPDNSYANPSMYPFSDTGPYYATLVCGATLDTKGGPATNTHGQVLDVAGDPIAGLYAAGNCAASPSADAYWAAGATIGIALTFGYIASEHLTSQPRRGGVIDRFTEATSSATQRC